MWARIHAEQWPYAWAYDAGMARLSCPMCVLAGWDDHVRAAALLPDLAERYAAAEAKTIAAGAAAAAAGVKGSDRGRRFTGRKTPGRSTVRDVIAAAQDYDI